MGMFNVRKPRGFNHQYIYVDERKEKLAKWKKMPSVIWNIARERIFSRRYSREVYRRYHTLEAS